MLCEKRSGVFVCGLHQCFTNALKFESLDFQLPSCVGWKSDYMMRLTALTADGVHLKITTSFATKIILLMESRSTFVKSDLKSCYKLSCWSDYHMQNDRQSVGLHAHFNDALHRRMSIILLCVRSAAPSDAWRVMTTRLHLRRVKTPLGVSDDDVVWATNLAVTSNSFVFVAQPLWYL